MFSDVCTARVSYRRPRTGSAPLSSRRATKVKRKEPDWIHLTSVRVAYIQLEPPRAERSGETGETCKPRHRYIHSRTAPRQLMLQACTFTSLILPDVSLHSSTAPLVHNSQGAELDTHGHLGHVAEQGARSSKPVPTAWAGSAFTHNAGPRPRRSRRCSQRR